MPFFQYREIESNSIRLCHNLVDDDCDVPGEDEDDHIEDYLSDPAHPETSPRVTSLSAISKLIVDAFVYFIEENIYEYIKRNPSGRRRM